MEADPLTNQLYLGDCLEVLKSLPAESIDLIYLDPPFFSNRNYEVIWGDDGEIRSFKDRWAGGMGHYIGWLKDRVQEMYRVLKPTGSIYLHCDWHADAYIRTGILDPLFGYENFRGGITWKRHNAHNDARNKVGVLTDTIFYYSKSKSCTFNGYWGSLSQKYLADFYKFKDEKGIYQLGDLTGAGINPNDSGWKGYIPSSVGRHWALPKDLLISFSDIITYEAMNCVQKLDLLYEKGYIELKEGGVPRFKRYLKDDAKKVLGNFWRDVSPVDDLSDKEIANELCNALLGNVWDDIGNVQGSSAERIGYPTQKPEKLLERIIQASSREGDMVLDPFVGGGTSVAVAQRLNRSFIGIDASPIAVTVSEGRLEKQADLFTKPFTVVTQKYDYNKMRYSDAFEFEKFIVEKSGGISNTKQRGDMGLDGLINKMPVQVKRSDNIGRNVIDNFSSACQRFDRSLYSKNIAEKTPIGRIIAFSFGKGAIEEAARLKNSDNIIIELVKVEDIIPLSTNPKVEIKIVQHNQTEKGWGLTFEATSNQSVLQYQWDVSYKDDIFKPEHIYSGENNSKINCTLKKGTHIVACRVINEDGIHGFETIKIKVNGKVETLE